MADTIVVVKQNGTGDYTSIQAAVDDADITGGRYIIEIQDSELYAENVVIGGSVGGPASLTNHIVLRVDDANYHAGVVGAGARIQGNTGDHTITIEEEWVHLLKLNVIRDSVNSISAECVRLQIDDAADESLIDRCILDGNVRSQGVVNQCDCVYSQGDVAGVRHTFYNSLFIDNGRSGIHDFQSQCNFNLEFCTIFRGSRSNTDGNAASVYLSRGPSANPVVNIYNTFAAHAAADTGMIGDWVGTATVAASNNASSDTTNTAGGDLTELDPDDQFTDPATFDCSIKGVDADIYLAGTDRSGSKPDSRVDATIDIAGNTRPSTPSIGCYEFVPTNPTVILDASLDAPDLSAEAVAIVKADLAIGLDAPDLAVQLVAPLAVNLDASLDAPDLVATMTLGSIVRDITASFALDAPDLDASATVANDIAAVFALDAPDLRGQIGPPEFSEITAAMALDAPDLDATVTVSAGTPAVFDDEAARACIYPAIFLDLVLDAGEVNVWTGVGQIEIESVEYLPLAGFDGAFSIQEGIRIEDLAADLRLAGQQAEFLSIALNEPVQGRTADVWLGMMDTANRLIARDLIFAGIIRNMPIRQSVESQDITIEVESSLVFRNNGAVLRCSSADQKLSDPTDTFFDFLPGLEASDLRFGR